MASGKQALLEDLRSRISLIESSGIPQFGSADSDEEGSLGKGPGRVSASRSSTSSDPYLPNEQSDRVFSKIGKLASRREYSHEGMRRRLLRYDFEEQDIEDALARADRCGLLDDARYAEVLVRSRLSQGKGLCGIARELRQDGIEPLSVPLYVEAQSMGSGLPHREVDRALEVLRSRPPHAKNPRQSAYRRLLSRGYDSSTASSAARIWAEQSDHSDRNKVFAPHES